MGFVGIAGVYPLRASDEGRYPTVLYTTCTHTGVRIRRILRRNTSRWTLTAARQGSLQGFLHTMAEQNKKSKSSPTETMEKNIHQRSNSQLTCLERIGNATAVSVLIVSTLRCPQKASRLVCTFSPHTHNSNFFFFFFARTTTAHRQNSSLIWQSQNTEKPFFAQGSNRVSYPQFDNFFMQSRLHSMNEDLPSNPTTVSIRNYEIISGR